MRPTPTYAPDGMSLSSFNRVSAGFSAQPIEVVHAHDRHDDGLVHSHNWASRSFAGPTNSVRFRASGIEVVHAHDRHDDGLVHSHNWAVTAQ